MSYNIENLSFTIWGNGHDYTLLDSGKGEVQIFSHPFVPLDSVNYAGQYYFLAPDENGEMMDVVKEDMAHITFDPPLGTSFDTVGEVTVKAHYYREYIYDEETIVVDKEVEQTIEVVDHGNVSRAAAVSFGLFYCSDIYDDGYAFLRPQNVNDLENVDYCQPWMDNNIKKVSSFYWRTESIGHYNGFLRVNGLDPDGLEELKYADTSRVKKIRGLVCENYTTDVDLTPVEGWDTHNVEDLTELLTNDYAQTSLKGLEGWDVSKVKKLDRAFNYDKSITDLSPISEWDVSNVESAISIFSGCESLTDLTPLAKWKVNKIKSLKDGFQGTTALSSLHGLEGWEVDALEDITEIFYRSGITSASALANWQPHLTAMVKAFCETKLTSLTGLGGLDVSGITDMTDVFGSNGKLTTCDGVETWDVSNVDKFYQTFAGCPWLSDLTAISGWLVSASNMDRMFNGLASILSTSDLDGWDFSNASLSAFMTGFTKYYSDAIDKDVWANGVGYYFDYEGNIYGAGGLGTITEYVKTASSAQSWNVTGSGLGAFNSPVWTNIPSWN